MVMLRSRLILGLLIMIIFIISACTIEAPGMPSWEIDLNVPLINGIYPAKDLVDDENISLSEDNELYFHSDGQLNNADVKDSDLIISSNPLGTELPITSNNVSGALSLVNPESDTDVEVAYGVILSGNLRFNYRNLSTNITKIVYEFREIFDALTHQTLVVEIPISEQMGNATKNLVGYYIENKINSSAVISELSFDIRIFSSDSSVSGFTRVCYTDPIVFSSIRGLVHNYIIDASSFFTDITLDYPDNIENAMIMNDPKMIFYIYNKTGFKSNFFATVTTYNDLTGKSESMDIVKNNLIFEASNSDTPLLTERVYTDEVKPLFQIAPNRLAVTKAYFVLNNPNTGVGFISVGNAYYGPYTAQVPFDFTFVPGEHVRPKFPSKIKISEKNRKEIEKRGRRLEISMKLRNYYPVGANVSVYFCSEPDKELIYVNKNETENFSRIFFTDRPVGEGSMTIPASAEHEFEISEELMQIFYKHEEIYFGIEFVFDETDTIIKPDERIDVVADLKAKLLMEF